MLTAHWGAKCKLKKEKSVQKIQVLRIIQTFILQGVIAFSKKNTNYLNPYIIRL